MAARMPPPSRDSGAPAIVIGIHKSDAPPGNGKMPPPGQPEPKKAGKASPEEAGVIRSDQRCIDCEHYDAQTGQCEEVDGTFDPQDACVNYFEAADGKEPDADEAGGASDNDADDQIGAQA